MSQAETREMNASKTGSSVGNDKMSHENTQMNPCMISETQNKP